MKEFSGTYGIVLKTDEETASMAEGLAERLLPIDADYKVKKEAAHITLYHLQVEGLGEQRVEEILLDTRNQIVSRHLTLDRIEVMGGKFLFWDVRGREKLLSAHRSGL